MTRKISVGIYVYNGMPYIREALHSIVNQTHKVDQIVISDNCSTDRTLETINDFKIKYPDYDWKINVNPTNLGFVANARKVIEMASSDYLLMLHADDYLKTYAIEKQLAFFIDHPDVALVGGCNDTINGAGALIKKHVTGNDLVFKKGDIFTFIQKTDSYLPFSTVMHKRNILNEIEFDWDSYIADELYWPKILKSYPIAKLGVALTYRRFHSSNTTHSYAGNIRLARKEIYRHLQVAKYQPEKKKDIYALLAKKYSNNCIAGSIQCLRRWQIVLAVKYLWFAISLDRFILFRMNPLYVKLLKIPYKIFAR